MEKIYCFHTLNSSLLGDKDDEWRKNEKDGKMEK